MKEEELDIDADLDSDLDDDIDADLDSDDSDPNNEVVFYNLHQNALE